MPAAARRPRGSRGRARAAPASGRGGRGTRRPTISGAEHDDDGGDDVRRRRPRWPAAPAGSDDAPARTALSISAAPAIRAAAGWFSPRSASSRWPAMARIVTIRTVGHQRAEDPAEAEAPVAVEQRDAGQDDDDGADDRRDAAGLAGDGLAGAVVLGDEQQRGDVGDDREAADEDQRDGGDPDDQRVDVEVAGQAAADAAEDAVVAGAQQAAAGMAGSGVALRWSGPPGVRAGSCGSGGRRGLGHGTTIARRAPRAPSGMTLERLGDVPQGQPRASAASGRPATRWPRTSSACWTSIRAASARETPRPPRPPAPGPSGGHARARRSRRSGLRPRPDRRRTRPRGRARAAARSASAWPSCGGVGDEQDEVGVRHGATDGTGTLRLR